MADLDLADALRAATGGSVDAEVGPRPSDLTLLLGRPSDLPAAAAVLTGPHAMALATVVATDETTTSDGDLKVRYVFEPTAKGAPDLFVTLLVSVDPRHPELPSLTTAVPAAKNASALVTPWLTTCRSAPYVPTGPPKPSPSATIPTCSTLW